MIVMVVMVMAAMVLVVGSRGQSCHSRVCHRYARGQGHHHCGGRRQSGQGGRCRGGHPWTTVVMIGWDYSRSSWSQCVDEVGGMGVVGVILFEVSPSRGGARMILGPRNSPRCRHCCHGRGH
ncbi:hypothetical protein BJV78DRAFT_1261966 [Lactifluus subvellereus]|nr:hypothetical protein BJV78DRAFT_1261966 [Lactifluus subvellereus]